MQWLIALSIIDLTVRRESNRKRRKTSFMRFNGCSITIASLAVLLGVGLPCSAKPFGTVVPIGGQASDIALDESRGLLYIANYTANRIDVMSTADYSIRRSMNVAPQPG